MQITADQFLYWGVALLPFVGGALAWILFDLVDIAAIRRRQRDRKAAIRAKNADPNREPVWDQEYRLTEDDFGLLEATEHTFDGVLDQSPARPVEWTAKFAGKCEKRFDR